MGVHYFRLFVWPTFLFLSGAKLQNIEVFFVNTRLGFLAILKTFCSNFQYATTIILICLILGLGMFLKYPKYLNGVLSSIQKYFRLTHSAGQAGESNKLFSSILNTLHSKICLVFLEAAATFRKVQSCFDKKKHPIRKIIQMKRGYP